MDERHKRTLELRILTSVIARTSIKALEQRLAETPNSISHLQLGILRTLLDGPQTISELSKRFMLDPSTLVSSVDGLESKGFLIRERDPNDRRRIPLSITGDGRKIVACVPMMTDDDPLFQAMESIGMDEIDQMINVLRRVVNQISGGSEMLEHMMQRIEKHTNTSQESE